VRPPSKPQGEGASVELRSLAPPPARDAPVRKSSPEAGQRRQGVYDRDAPARKGSPESRARGDSDRHAPVARFVPAWSGTLDQAVRKLAQAHDLGARNVTSGEPTLETLLPATINASTARSGPDSGPGPSLHASANDNLSVARVRSTEDEPGAGSRGTSRRFGFDVPALAHAGGQPSRRRHSVRRSCPHHVIAFIDALLMTATWISCKSRAMRPPDMSVILCLGSGKERGEREGERGPCC
jgi:hypothetical protein